MKTLDYWDFYLSLTNSTIDELKNRQSSGKYDSREEYAEISERIAKERTSLMEEFLGEDKLVLGDSESIEIHYSKKGIVWYRFCLDHEEGPEELRIYDNPTEFLDAFGFFNLMKLLPTEES